MIFMVPVEGLKKVKTSKINKRDKIEIGFVPPFYTFNHCAVLYAKANYFLCNSSEFVLLKDLPCNILKMIWNKFKKKSSNVLKMIWKRFEKYLKTFNRRKKTEFKIHISPFEVRWLQTRLYVNIAQDCE